MVLSRTTRVQGAVVRETSLLLVQHREHATGRTYWLLPGGSPMAGETEEAALAREIEEETHLTVDVIRLLFDDPTPGDPVYLRFRTYLCHSRAGSARPGFEPEPEIAPLYEISAVQWIELAAEADWDAAVRADAWTYPLLKRIQVALGFDSRPAS